METRVNALRHEAGFTIIEVLIAMFVLLLGVLATTTMLNTANAETERNQARNGATNLVRDIIEASRALPYTQANPTIDANGVADSTLVTALQNMAPSSGGSASGSSFADGDTAASGWQITRRGVTYNVSLQSCVVDDSKDGVVTSHGTPASDGSGYYCPDLPTTSTILTADPDGDDYRRIKVTASWTSNSCNSCSTPGQAGSAKTYSVMQTGVIVNPTGGLGPPPKSPPTYTNPINCRSVTVNQVYPVETVAVLFKVDDPISTDSSQTVPTATDSTTGDKTFSFLYQPAEADVPDGRYEMKIQGINRAGRPGPITTVDLYINCKEPDAASNVNGGFDWRRCANYPVACAAGDRVFDLDWDASPDNDVVGYYVWRVNGSVPDFQGGETDDTKVACVSRSQATTTTIPGDVDFLEPFQPGCYDTAIQDPDTDLFPFPDTPGIISLDGRTGTYWIQAVDLEPTNNPVIIPTSTAFRTTGLTNHTDPFTKTENMLNVRPTMPAALEITNSNGQPCLSWPDSTDVDWQDNSITSPILFYRVYRDTSLVVSTSIVVQGRGGTSVSVQVPDVPYKDRIGRAVPGATECAGSHANSFIDKSAPASGHYWVTAVDKDYLESFPTINADWTSP